MVERGLPVRRFSRSAGILLLAALPAGAQQIAGHVVGTTGTSISPRFGVLGSIELDGQTRSSAARFAIAPLTPTQRDSIVFSHFE